MLIVDLTIMVPTGTSENGNSWNSFDTSGNLKPTNGEPRFTCENVALIVISIHQEMSFSPLSVQNLHQLLGGFSSPFFFCGFHHFDMWRSR